MVHCHECFPYTRAGEIRQHQSGIRPLQLASEVVREALRLLEEHEQARAAQLAEFNRELGRRLDSLDRGEHVDPADVRARLKRKSAAARSLTRERLRSQHSR